MQWSQIWYGLEEAWQALFCPEGPTEAHIRFAKSSNGSEPTDRRRYIVLKIEK